MVRIEFHQKQTGHFAQWQNLSEQTPYLYICSDRSYLEFYPPIVLLYDTHPQKLLPAETILPPPILKSSNVSSSSLQRYLLYFQRNATPFILSGLDFNAFPEELHLKSAENE
jgi:hypothetical protein